jgi:hypothetical protein
MKVTINGSERRLNTFGALISLPLFAVVSVFTAALAVVSAIAIFGAYLLSLPFGKKVI